MHILYVCAAGARRSLSLALYTTLFAQKERFPLTAACGAGDQEIYRIQHQNNHKVRLVECKLMGEPYAAFAERLETAGSRADPRMAALIYEDIGEPAAPFLLQARPALVTPQHLQEADIVLPVAKRLFGTTISP